MANAIFAASESSNYDDRIEERYHFPKTYLGQRTPAIGELIHYHERRLDAGISSVDGRQTYFAVKRLVSIEPDSTREGHFYTHLFALESKKIDSKSDLSTFRKRELLKNSA